MPTPALERPPLDWQSEPASAGTKTPGCLLGSDQTRLYAKRCEIDHSGPPTQRQFGTRRERHIFREWTEIQADPIDVARAGSPIERLEHIEDRMPAERKNVTTPPFFCVKKNFPRFRSAAGLE